MFLSIYLQQATEASLECYWVIWLINNESSLWYEEFLCIFLHGLRLETFYFAVFVGPLVNLFWHRFLGQLDVKWGFVSCEIKITVLLWFWCESSIWKWISPYCLSICPRDYILPIIPTTLWFQIQQFPPPPCCHTSIYEHPNFRKLKRVWRDIYNEEIK